MIECRAARYLMLIALLSTSHCADESQVTSDIGNADSGTDAVQEDPASTCQGAANGTLCDDGDPCSLDDSCQGGICVGGTNRTCDSDNPCEVGVCDPVSGDCSYAELPDGSPCNLACYGGSTCQSGQCSVNPANAVDCGAEIEEAKKLNPCLEELRCDPATGTCVEEIFVPAGTPCDVDGDLCTLEVCSDDGVCEDQDAVVSCSGEMAVDPCATYACSPDTGACEKTGFAGPIPCDDQNACTMNDSCSSDEFGFFLCKGTPVLVDDNNPCTDDTCKQGVITNTPIPGLPCEAKTNCSNVWLCSANGACEPGPANSTCAKGLLCTAPYCDPVSGGCVKNILENFCVIDDSCVAEGQLNPNNSCQICDSSQTKINWTAVPKGTGCSDGDACTQGDECDGKGTCSAGSAPECLGTECSSAECDPSTGGCMTADVDAGYCLIGGKCYAQAEVSADNVCLECDPLDDNKGWSPKPAEDLAVCGDDDPCNGAELCDGSGGCSAGPPIACDDGESCTLDSCDPSTGECVFTPKLDCPVLVQPITQKDLNGVWVDEEGTVWAVGDSGTVLKAVSGVWQKVEVPPCMATHDLLSISGFSGGEFWIGANEESLMRFDGTTFHCADPNGNPYVVQPGPNDNRIHKVSTQEPSTVMAFRYIKEAAGYFLHIFEYAGVSWKNVVMAAGFGASGIPARPVVPCANNDVVLSTFPNANLGQTNAKIQRFTGQASLTLLNPIQDPANPIREMRDGVCLSASDITMVGHFGQVTHWNGQTLTSNNLYLSLPEEARPTLWGVAGNQNVGFIAVGDGGAIARNAGNGWTELDEVLDTRLNDVFVKGDTAWAVGGSGAVVRIDLALP